MGKLSSLLIGFFAGFLMPYLAFAALIATFQYQDASGKTTMPGWFLPLPYLLLVVTPVLAGFVAARVAKVQPLLHGLLVAIPGGIAGTFVLSMNTWPIITLFWLACLTGGVLGGWLQKRGARRPGEEEEQEADA